MQTEYKNCDETKIIVNLSFKDTDNLEKKTYSDGKYVLTKLKKETDADALNKSEVQDYCESNFYWHRSVIWERQASENEENLFFPVCVAPPREYSISPENKNQGHVEEFLEGTMINVFVTANHLEPQIASRSSLGATGLFYSKRTFKELFLEAIANEGKVFSSMTFSLCGESTENNAADISPHARFWSFVLRHPENRSVEYIHRAELVLIHEGWTDKNGTITIINRPDVNINSNVCMWKLPTRYNFEPTVEVVENAVSELADIFDATWQGLVIRYNDGNRKKIINPKYTRLRSWRTEPNRDIRLLWLIRENSQIISEYMNYFHEDLDRFLDLNRMIKKIYKDLYNTYQEVHIRRTKNKDDIIDYYKPHVFSLHGIYLNSLKQRKWFIRAKEVKEYINSLPLPRVFYIIRRIENVHI